MQSACPTNDDGFDDSFALQHRAVERITIDEGGKQRTGYRAVTTILDLFNGKEIDLEQLQAAEEFKKWFILGCFDALQASAMDGMPRGHGRYIQPDERENVEAARKKVREYYGVLLGPESRLSRAMFHIVGMDRGFGGRCTPKAVKTSRKTCLIIALEMLVWHKNGGLKKYS